MADLLAGLVRRLTDLAFETAAALGDTSARSDLMARAGLPAPAGDPPSSADLTAALTALNQRAAQPGGGDDALTLLRDLGDAMTTVVTYVQEAAAADSADAAWNYLATFLDIIFIDRLRRQTPETLALMQVLHLISNDRLLIADLIRAGDQWGAFLLGHPDSGDAEADNWSIILGAILAVAGKWIPPEDNAGKAWRMDILFGWDPDPTPVHPRAQHALQRAATFRLTHRDGEVTEQTGITAIVVPPADGGWGVFIALELGAGITFPIGEHLELLLQADVPNALDAFFGPAPFATQPSGAGANAKLLLRRKAEVADAWVIGPDDGTHLEVGTFVTGVELGDPTRLRFSVGDGALVIAQKSLGTFLGSALPSGGAKVTFDVEAAMDTDGKVSLAGGAGMTVTVPVNKTFSVFAIRAITVSLSSKDGETGAGPSLSALAAFSARFGGSTLVATVNQVGAKLLWALPSSPQPADSGAAVAHGNLGTYGDLSVDFVPPKGIGLQIDFPPVTGGGFLFFDPPHRTYGGVLEASLTLCSTQIQIKAAGLLRETDSGWSFALIISAQFTPAIELFLGLSLTGVGGIVGHNLGIDLDKLRTGLHDGAVGRLLFPDNPVANAPAILATMSAVFPPRPGGTVAGVMLQLGWGHPDPIGHLSVAVIRVSPSPVTWAILGRLEVVAPTKRSGVISLKAEFLGVISHEPSVTFDASLIDSKLGTFPITGDLALRAGAPGFILAVGGVNPNFTSPIPLPTMRRIAVDISASKFTKIRAQAYLAITSNTFQLGVHASLDIDAGPASIHGWVDLDALIQWSPRWYFSVHLDVGLELRVGGESIAGVSVDLLLEGPGPWHAKGTASLDFLFFTVHASFETTWGEVDRVSQPPAVEATSIVVQALSEPGAWSAVAPEGDAIVTFRDVQRADTGVHPYGQLSVRQQAAPLGIAITRIGRSPVAGGSETVTVTPAAGAPASAPSTGLFAASQFFDLSDDEKLSRPSFESFQDGVVFGSRQITHSAAQPTTADYETVFIPDGRRHRGTLDAGVLLHAIAVNSVARSGLHQASLFDGPDQRVRLSGGGYRVVDASTLTAVAGQPQIFTSMAAAVAAAGADPGLVVVGAHEVVG